MVINLKNFMRLFGLLFLFLTCFELQASNDQDGPGKEVPNKKKEKMKILYIDDPKLPKDFYQLLTFFNIAYSKVQPEEDKDTKTEKSKD